MRLWYYMYHASKGPQFALYSGKPIEEYYTTLVAEVVCSLYVLACKQIDGGSANKG